jgi:predicted NAD-dependent protein-ADP-ribosyltransferase YbiA (DUF1768 family)
MIEFNFKNEEYDFLSNMSPIPGGITVPVKCDNGQIYHFRFSSVENAFQGYKCFSEFNAVHSAPEIAAFAAFADGRYNGNTIKPNPKAFDAFEARKRGKQIRNFNKEQWESVKVPIMEYLVKKKFSTPSMKEKLLATSDSLVESGTGDRFWGTENGEGENRLGKIIMAERSRLRELPRTYAGIGSRETPPGILAYMTETASKLEGMGYILNSGGARGADSAFADGVKNKKNTRILIPESEANKSLWDKRTKSFVLDDKGNKQPKFPGKNYRTRYHETPEGLASVDKYHPNPQALGPSARELMARDYYQVMGNPSANMFPASFVLCWAPVDKDGNALGGTGQAVKIAEDHHIPVYNLSIPKEKERFESDIFGIQAERIPEKKTTPREHTCLTRLE